MYLIDGASKCCLGFFGLACGILYGEMYFRTSPAVLDNKAFLPSPYSSLLDDLGRNTDLAEEMMKINDGRNLLPAEREAMLKTLFAKIDVEVEFED